MIWTIARREFLEYLKSLRFLIGFLVTIALVALSTVINVSDYRERVSDYSTAKKEMAGDTYPLIVYRPPEVLSTLVQGLDRTLGNRASMTPARIPARTSGYMENYASQHHRFVAGFSTVDFAFVVRIILSLIVIFLAYNSVAGEKSAGTLRLILSHPVPRYAVLLGKFAGGLMLVLVSLFAAMIVALLILITHPAVTLTVSDWIRILGMGFVSGLYLATIFALSIFVSVIVNSPSTSLLILLQAWIFVVVLYPAGALIFAEHWRALPGEPELEDRKKAAFQPFEKEYEEVRKAFGDSLHLTGSVPQDIDLRSHDLDIRRGKSDHAVDAQLAGEQNEQMRLAESIAIFSPAALYDQAMVRLARTGAEEFDRFLEGIHRTWNDYTAIMRSFITDPEKRKTTHMPEFTAPRESDEESFIAVVPQVIVMLFLLMIPFMSAHAKFNAKDVR